MAIRIWATVVNGTVTGITAGDGRDGQLPPNVVDVTDRADAWQLGGSSYDGTTFTAPAAATGLRVTPAHFLGLFTEAEEIAIDLIASRTSGTLQEQRVSAALRVWLRRVQAADEIPLNNPLVATQLARLKAVLIPSVWADTATADARIAQILANETP